MIILLIFMNIYITYPPWTPYANLFLYWIMKFCCCNFSTKNVSSFVFTSAIKLFQDFKKPSSKRLEIQRDHSNILQSINVSVFQNLSYLY